MDDFKFYRRLNRMYLAFALFFIGLLELGALFGDIIFMLFGFACAFGALYMSDWSRSHYQFDDVAFYAEVEK